MAQQPDAPPRYATPRTPSRATYGPAIGGLYTDLTGGRRHPMPWQRQVLDVGTEVLEDGSWAFDTVVVTIQRQAGKTTVVCPLCLHRGIIRPMGRTWLVDARSRQDGRDTFMDGVDLVETAPPELRRLFRTRRANGSESITGPARGTFRLTEPSGDGLHGKANELIASDEGWAYDAAQGAQLLQGALPTFTTTAGQLWALSTAGTAQSAWLRALVERGRAAAAAGVTTGLAYFEWSVDDIAAATIMAGLDPDNGQVSLEEAFDAVLRYHPAANYTLKRQALAQAAREMTPGDFLRAYGNFWTGTAERVIPDHVWTARRAESWPPPPEQGVALAFATALDRSAAAIVAAWRDTPTSPLRVDVVEHHDGDAWVARRVKALAEKWRTGPVGYNGAGGALDIADTLDRAGVQLRRVDAREYGAACAGFLSDVLNGRMAHGGQPALDAAVEAAAQRTLGDAGWAWSHRHAAGSIAALEAATVAGWTYDHRPPSLPGPAVVTSRRRRPAARRRPEDFPFRAAPAGPETGNLAAAGKVRVPHPG